MSTSGGPNITLDGLRVYIDPRNPESYVTGSIIYDLLNANTYTLQPGAAYDPRVAWTFHSSSAEYIETSEVWSKPQLEDTGCCWEVWMRTNHDAGAAGTDGVSLLNQSVDSAGTYERNGGINFRGGGEAQFVMYNGSAYIDPTSTTVVNDGVWHQIVGNFTSDHYMQIYVDGVMEAEQYNSASYDTSATTMRIAWGDGAPQKQPLDGNIGVVRLYDRPLSVEEIGRNYKGTLQT